jgi:putative aldouronate transport system permease protein
MRKAVNNPGEFIVDSIIVLIMLFVGFVTLYPFWFSIVMSFNEGLDARAGGIFFWPRAFTLENYRNIFATNRIINAFYVTVARTIVGTVFSVLFTAVVAYGMSKRDLMFRKVYSRIGIITMYFSGGLIPFYFLLMYIGLLDTFWVFIFPMLTGYFNIMLFVANYRQIPESLPESARLDGAGELSILVRIILPSSLPIIATIALFNGVAHWNAWFDSALFTMSPHLRVLQTILFEIINYASNIEEMRRHMNIPDATMTVEALRYTTMVVAVLPITFVYPFLQRFFVKGMMVGAIKG